MGTYTALLSKIDSVIHVLRYAVDDVADDIGHEKYKKFIDSLNSLYEVRRMITNGETR
jgi:hypothetical protein